MTHRYRMLLNFCCLIILVVLAGCTHRSPISMTGNPDPEITTYLGESALPADQLLVVVAQNRTTSRARLYFLERGEREWEQRLGPFPAMIGRNGFAPIGEKREGDGKSPSGLFPLELVFGYEPSIATRMPYRQATKDDLWVDDVKAPD